MTKNLNIIVDGEKLDVQDPASFPISVNYKTEDDQDFQNKTASDALSITVPASLNNSKISNSFSNVSVRDLSVDESYRNMRRCVIVCNTIEILVGQCRLVKGSHTNCPVSYEYDVYGNNGEWMILLKDTTFFDILQDISYTFDTDVIEDSWNFDGSDAWMDLPFVFAPVRYGQIMDQVIDQTVSPNVTTTDKVMAPDYFKPSLAVYWLLYRGFKSIGYTISSDFMNTDYFRRMVMPWVWGNYLFSDGTQKDSLLFLAKSTADQSITDSFGGAFDLEVTNIGDDGGFDNNGVYTWDPAAMEMTWTYLPAFDFGTLEGHFHLQLEVNATVKDGGLIIIKSLWYLNGVLQQTIELTNIVTAPLSSKSDISVKDDWQTFTVNPGDTVSCIVEVTAILVGGTLNIVGNVLAFEAAYFRVPVGGTINFADFDSLKNFNFLDCLAGIVDCFDIIPVADPVNKVILLEPAHPYSVDTDIVTKSGGYFNQDFVDWENKQDLSKQSDVNSVADQEREYTFKFKDDGNDGMLKLVQDRYTLTVAKARYVFPDRFQAGEKIFENRFFSPMMHYYVLQWINDNHFIPQMPCLIPENISNTSQSASQNTFQPKLAWYKGIDENYSWYYNSYIPIDGFPFMFSVNYRRITGVESGVDDPVISYTDEAIGDPDTDTNPLDLATGLLKRFFWQRLAIMRMGVQYSTYMNLRNGDVMQPFHREHKKLQGQRWELVEIQDYKPFVEDSTQVLLQLHAPIEQQDLDAIYPTSDAVLKQVTTVPPTTSFLLQYRQLVGRASDIPSIGVGNNFIIPAAP